MKFRILCILLVVIGKIYPANPGLIPQPKELKWLKGNFILTDKTPVTLSSASLSGEAGLLKKLLGKATGFTFTSINKTPAIHLVLSGQMPVEAYKISVESGKVEIMAAGFPGFSNAFQTLLQLLPPSIYSDKVIKKQVWSIPNVLIEDEPLYSWRGAMLDVSRQFYDIASLKKYIDWMAAHKLNIFHLHLTDDEGWRMEIKAYPKLTEVGAWRGPNEALPPAHGSGNKRYGGFYTQAELKNLVQYAAERNVSILPEIDLPGHSKSVAVSYPEILCDGNDTTKSVQGVSNNVWCAGRDRNYAMLDTISGEVASIFPMEYIHVGGDEVNFRSWEHCSRCKQKMLENHFAKPSELQNFFISRVQEIVEKHGKWMIGWNEVLENSTLDKKTPVMVWTSNDEVETSLRKQHPTILCPAAYFYIDMKQGVGERGHDWATILPMERLYSYPLPADSLSNKLVWGVQANLWSEYLDEPAYQTEYQFYPRLCALSELAWSGNRMTYRNFEERLNNSHYKRLFAMGIHFRVPTPDVKVKNGNIRILNAIPGSKIVCTTDSTLPARSSAVLSGNEKIKLITHHPAKMLFRTCFNDSLLSPAVSLACDTIGGWNPEILSRFASTTISVFIHPDTECKDPSNTLILKYMYGSSEVAVKKLEIFRDDISVFSKVFSKPVSLFSHTAITELPLPGDCMSKGGKYRIDLETTGKTGTDSYGVILMKNSGF